MNKRGLGILACSPSSDGFNLCLRKDILVVLWESFPRADAGCPAPVRYVWVISVKCIVFSCRWEKKKEWGGMQYG